MKKTIQKKVNFKLHAQLERWQNQDFSKRNLQRFAQAQPWILDQFELAINQFYNNKLFQEIINIPLPAALREEVYLLGWTEVQGFSGFVNNLDVLRRLLYKWQSAFYLRLNYYDNLIDANEITPAVIFMDAIRAWEANLIQRIYAFRYRKIQEKRDKYLRQLFNTIKILQEHQELLKTTFDFFGRFWDLTNVSLRKLDFGLLTKFAQYLEQTPAIMEIARLLGRWAGISELIEERVYQKISIQTTQDLVGRWPEEIIGITHSRDLERLIYREYGLTLDPLLWLIFAKKYVEGQLLTREFVSWELVPYVTIVNEKVAINIPEEAGPVIIALDTSRSMQGISEAIAKAITLAILKIAFNQKRPCYIINFATTINCFDFSDQNARISDFIKFLSLGFNSNTNIEPALKQAVFMMGQGTFRNADLIMLSDLAAPDISDDLATEIRRLQWERNRFQAIVFGKHPQERLKKIFNHAWYYNANKPFTQSDIIEQLYQELTPEMRAHAQN